MLVVLKKRRLLLAPNVVVAAGCRHGLVVSPILLVIGRSFFLVDRTHGDAIVVVEMVVAPGSTHPWVVRAQQQQKMISKRGCARHDRRPPIFILCSLIVGRLL